MGKTNERRRQAILTRKKAKRKNKSRNRLANALGNRETSPFHGAESPIHECLVPVEIFEIGIGNVIVSRGLASGEIGMAAFLVDVFCRGVKDALYVTVDPYEYVRITAELHDLEEMQQVAPCCAMKLVEGAVDHARQSGIEPHHGYQKAKKIFGGIDPGECTCEYEFGFDDEFLRKETKGV